MTNTPMTSREAFESFDREHFGKKDMPINYETWECPMLGTRYVDAFVQSRYAYWQASQAEQAKVIAELQTDLSQAKETIETLNAGKPIGDIVGLHIAQNAVTKALGYKQTIAELVEALEEAMYSNSTETAKQKYQAIIAKVKDK